MINSGLTFYDKDFLKFENSGSYLKENIKRVLMTRPGERINNLAYGSRLKEYLFDITNVAIEDILDEIKSSIERCEPRVSITDVVIEKVDSETIYVNIYAKEKGNDNNVNLSLGIQL